MKDIIIDNFDGVVMSAVVGTRVELDESKALAIINGIASRKAAASDKAARIESLRVEMETLKNEAAIEAPAIEADTADAKALIKNLIDCYAKRDITPPNALIAFIGEAVVETPAVATVTV